MIKPKRVDGIRDLSGLRFHQLVSVRYSGYINYSNKQYHSWLCRCDCGNLKVFKGQYLTNKKGPKSCGCIQHQGSPVDITNKRFGRLVATKRLQLSSNKDYYWECICDCGNICEKPVGQLNNKPDNQSCGCLEYERKVKLKTTHGLSGTHEHKTWLRIKQRCHNTNHPDYIDYGAKGLIVDEEWLNSFIQFMDDVGESPGDNYSLDRIDPDQGYIKGNVRWALPIGQSRNRRGHINTTSQYKGVYWDKEYGKWVAAINVNKIVKKIGRYHSEQVAAHAYNKAFSLVFGEDYPFKQLNDVDIDDDPSYYTGRFWKKGYRELQEQVKILDEKYGGNTDA